MFRARDLIKLPKLDIFLTHAHLDHCMGLTFIFDVLHGKDVKKVSVYGEDDKLKAINEHLFSPMLFPVKFPFEMKALQGESIPLSEGGTISWFPLEHPGGSVGYRLDFPGKSLAYVTDTTAVEDAPYLNHIQDVDVLIHECYFPDGWEERAKLTGHSCSTPVGKVAKAANVGKLYLVHMNPIAENHEDPIDIAAVQKVFPNTHYATDNLEIDF